MLHEIPYAASSIIAPLFKEFSDTLVLSYLQGQHGRAWADDVLSPRCAKIVMCDLAFFAGDPTLPAAAELAAHDPDGFAFAFNEDYNWGRVLYEVYGEKCYALTRYATRKGAEDFDRDRLHGFINALPPGFTLARIEGALYDQAMAVPDFRDFCANFISKEDFERRGLGYCVLYEGEMVGGASSFTVFNGGLEVQICTAEPYRRKGLAAACAARLILTCLETGLYPSWDAGNLASLRLAEKLGYVPAYPYTIHALDRG